MFDSGLVVSCQPRLGGYFTEDAWKFASDAQTGGAVAVRVEGVANVEIVSSAVDIPVIGLKKVRSMDRVIITPNVEYAENLISAGADYIAADVTGRFGYEHIEKMVAAGYQVIGDVASVDDAVKAEELGCVAVTTALSGYTEDPSFGPFNGPDFPLIARCVQAICIPVIAEGRYWTRDDVRRARQIGAHSVCIGAAITLPDMITRYFAGVA